MEYIFLKDKQYHSRQLRQPTSGEIKEYCRKYKCKFVDNKLATSFTMLYFFESEQRSENK